MTSTDNSDNAKLVSELLSNDPASLMLGIELEHVVEGECTVSMTVKGTMCNGYQVCHGGFIYTLADTSLAFCSAVSGAQAVSASGNIEFIQPAHVGDKLTSQAVVTYKKGRQQYCDAIVKNQNNEIVALSKGRQVVIK